MAKLDASNAGWNAGRNYFAKNVRQTAHPCASSFRCAKTSRCGCGLASLPHGGKCVLVAGAWQSPVYCIRAAQENCERRIHAPRVCLRKLCHWLWCYIRVALSGSSYSTHKTRMNHLLFEEKDYKITANFRRRIDKRDSAQELAHLMRRLAGKSEPRKASVQTKADMRQN